MAADRLAGEIRGCCPRNEPEQTASAEKLMLYINKLELHEWITTVCLFLFAWSPVTHCKHTRVQRDTQKEEGYKGSESEREVFARLTILDSFQGYCQSLWRSGK